VAYLNEVVAQADWRDHKLVQALGPPGPGGMPLFKKIIRFLNKVSDGQDSRQALLEHIYELMLREQNPILEEEPLRHFLAAYSTDSESDGEGYLDPVFYWYSDDESDTSTHWDDFDDYCPFDCKPKSLPMYLEVGLQNLGPYDGRWLPFPATYSIFSECLPSSGLPDNDFGMALTPEPRVRSRMSL
jgi:hypothetical protein